jgi:hypothetical protein
VDDEDEAVDEEVEDTQMALGTTPLSKVIHCIERQKSQDQGRRHFTPSWKLQPSCSQHSLNNDALSPFGVVAKSTTISFCITIE